MADLHPLKESSKTKRCPYCHTRLKTEDTQCFHCKNKVGPPNEFGIAKKPFDWMSYLIAIVSGGGFIYFMYWLFFIKDRG